MVLQEGSLSMGMFPSGFAVPGIIHSLYSKLCLLQEGEAPISLQEI